MKRNIVIIAITLLVISLIVVTTAFAVSTRKANESASTCTEEMHKSCIKDPAMKKHMEQMHGEDWKKHHEEAGDNMEGHMGKSGMM